jgi:hypothetical protein
MDIDVKQALIDVIVSENNNDGNKLSEWTDLDIDFSQTEISLYRLDYEKLDPLISPEIIASTSFTNDTDSLITQRFSDRRTTTTTASWSLDHTINLSLTASASASFVLSASVTASTSISFREQQSGTTSQSQEWSWDASVPVPPRSRVEVNILVQKATYSPRFTAILLIDKSLILRGNLNGKARAIMVIPGLTAGITIEKYSFLSVFLDTSPNAPPDAWRHNMSALKLTLSGRFNGVVGVNKIVTAKQFPINSGEQVALTILPSRAPAAMQVDKIADGPTIGPSDGVTYSILSTREDRRATPLCGYNDIGVPNTGVYRIESRLYTEYRTGSLVRTWQEDAETFVRCED